jgi:hypothetical protein
VRQHGQFAVDRAGLSDGDLVGGTGDGLATGSHQHGFFLALMLVPLDIETADLAQGEVAEERNKVQVQPLALHLQIFAAFDLQAIKVLRGGLAHGERDFATFWQRKAIILRVAAHFLDELFGLRAGGAVRFAADNAVDALAVHHDVDSEHTVTGGRLLERDPVFVDPAAWRELPHFGSGQLAEGLRHVRSRSKRNVVVDVIEAG